MPLTRDKGFVVKYGGGILKLVECDDSGVVVTGATAEDLGYIQETTISDTTNSETQQDETGNIIQEIAGNRVVKLTAVLMQTNKDLIDFLKEDVKNKYFQVYYRAHNNVNGKVQEILFAIGKVKPGIEINSLQRRIPIEISFLKNENQIIQGNAETLYGAVASSITIPANQYYAVVETTIEP